MIITYNSNKFCNMIAVYNTGERRAWALIEYEAAQQMLNRQEAWGHWEVE